MIRLFRKIPITIYPSFWFLAFLLGVLLSSTNLQIFIWVAIVLISVVVHELGHALSGILCGQKVAIELWAFGGMTYRQGGTELSKSKEFFIVIMGPVFGLLLALLCFEVSTVVPKQYVNVSYTLEAFYEANIFWTIINLLPIHPMDGGKLLGIIFEALFGKGGYRYSFLFSSILSFVILLASLATNNLFFVVIFLLFAYESFREFQRLKGALTFKEDQAVIEEMQKADHEWHEHQQDQAIQRLEAITKSIKGENSSLDALYLLAHYYVARGQYEQAYDALKKAGGLLSVEGNLLLQLAAYKLNKYEDALQAGKKAFLEEANSDCALINAFASSKLKRVQDALNWLHYVQKTATVDFHEVLQSNDFDPIRSDPAFQKLAQ